LTDQWVTPSTLGLLY